MKNELQYSQEHGETELLARNLTGRKKRSEKKKREVAVHSSLAKNGTAREAKMAGTERRQGNRGNMCRLGGLHGGHLSTPNGDRRSGAGVRG
jgi:hypothetical protein